MFATVERMFHRSASSMAVGSGWGVSGSAVGLSSGLPSHVFVPEFLSVGGATFFARMGQVYVLVR